MRKSIISLLPLRRYLLLALAFGGMTCGMPAWAEPVAAAAENGGITTVTGEILDNEGEPLIGASIVVKGLSLIHI